MSVTALTPEPPISHILIIGKDNCVYASSINKRIKNFDAIKFPIHINQKTVLQKEDIEAILLFESKSNTTKIWRKNHFYSKNASPNEKKAIESLFKRTRFLGKEDDKQCRSN